jgi:hypothetical protein
MKSTLVITVSAVVIAVLVYLFFLGGVDRSRMDSNLTPSPSPSASIPVRNEETASTSPEIVTQTPMPTVSHLVLSIGKTSSLGDVKIKLVSILSDSRCAEGFQCIWAGDVTARLDLTQGNLHDVYDLKNTDPIQSFGSYILKIESVTPYPKAGVAIKAADYRVTLQLSKASQ